MLSYYLSTKTTVTGDEFQLKKSEHEMDLQLEKYAFSNALGSSGKEICDFKVKNTKKI